MHEKINVPLIGGVLAGLAASACCVGPLILLFLGFGGAWVSNLTDLEPYRPIFIGIAFVALFMAYQRIYRPRAKQQCEANSVCAKPHINDAYKWLFIAAVVIVSASIASPYLISIFYG
ncbi:MAG: mercuric ion transporter MerT [Mariprofundaceae bacterium]